MPDDISTKDRILDAAERLFAARGFDATSLRAITAEARVNIAAVNYHFQSKETLIQAVFQRRLGPINRARIELLNRLEAAHPSSVPIEKLLEAFIRPVLESGHGFGRLFGRLYGDPHDLMKRTIGVEMVEIAQRYGAAFHRALPHLSAAELAFRLHFLIGAIAHTLASSSLLEILSKGACNTSDTDEVTRRMVNFFSAGLMAPMTGASR